MTLAEYKKEFTATLEKIYPAAESLSILKILTEDLMLWKQSDFLFNDREQLTTSDLQKLTDALEQLKESIPVQYITGNAHFYGRQFKVNKHTLIPRQETEELVHKIITENKHKESLKIIDIGTGTGCIGLTLAAEMPQAEVRVVDVSKQALKVAQKNAETLDVNVKLLQADILDMEELLCDYDVIVSNPPYVRELEKQEIKANVLNNEPHLALFVADDNALVFYRKILELAKTALKPKGNVYFEINQYLPEESIALAQSLGYQAEAYKDLNENWRMMKCFF